MTSSCTELEPFALQVLDESMAPEFPPGCVVVIEPARTAAAGDFVVAESPEGLVLRVVREAGAGRRLEALAAGVPAVPLDAEAGVAIRGVVVQRAPSRAAPRKRYG